MNNERGGVGPTGQGATSEATAAGDAAADGRPAQLARIKQLRERGLSFSDVAASLNDPVEETAASSERSGARAAHPSPSLAASTDGPETSVADPGDDALITLVPEADRSFAPVRPPVALPLRSVSEGRPGSPVGGSDGRSTAVAAAMTRSPASPIEPVQTSGELRRWPLVVGGGLAVLGLGFGTWVLWSGNGAPVASGASNEDQDPTAAAVSSPSTDGVDPADLLELRIEPESADDEMRDSASGVAAELAPATATIRNGELHFEGTFRSEAEAERYIALAAEVFGDDAIVRDYVIDPGAPQPLAADVGLDKPVLFEKDSATIHPDFVPFLEACAEVLALNPHIVMSISAYTDSIGDNDYNLELSQRRAQAIYDFYAELDIADDQLVATGYGEDSPYSDNETDEGRTQNRRAMLELLNVMTDAGAPSPEEG